MAEVKLSDATKKLWEDLMAADADLSGTRVEHARDADALNLATQKEANSADALVAKQDEVIRLDKQLIAGLLADAGLDASTLTAPPPPAASGPAPEEDDGTY